MVLREIYKLPYSKSSCYGRNPTIILFYFSAQHYEVALPADLKCIDCSIRLVRQANEWGKKYQFWSCADVDILPKSENFLNICSGHGKSYSGRCRCDRNFYGEYCQFQDECSKDQDCGIHGRCVDIMSTSSPRKQCYCREGFFGPKCNKENPKVLGKRNFQEGLYTKKDLSDKMTLYWRLLKDIQEIEIVMKAKSSSWVAVGWRPQGLTGSCKKFPVLADTEPEARSLNLDKYPAGADSDSEPEPESEPSDKYDSIEAEAEAEAEPASAAQVSPRDARSDKDASAKRKRMIMNTRTDVGISFRTSSVSGGRTKRSPIDRSLYTPRFPRAFAIPLRDGDEKEEQDTTSAPQGELQATENSVPDFSSELYRFATQTCNQFVKQT